MNKENFFENVSKLENVEKHSSPYLNMSNKRGTYVIQREKTKLNSYLSLKKRDIIKKNSNVFSNGLLGLLDEKDSKMVSSAEINLNANSLRENKTEKIVLIKNNNIIIEVLVNVKKLPNQFEDVDHLGENAFVLENRLMIQQKERFKKIIKNFCR